MDNKVQKDNGCRFCFPNTTGQPVLTDGHLTRRCLCVSHCNKTFECRSRDNRAKTQQRQRSVTPSRNSGSNKRRAVVPDLGRECLSAAEALRASAADPLITLSITPKSICEPLALNAIQAAADPRTTPPPTHPTEFRVAVEKFAP